MLRRSVLDRPKPFAKADRTAMQCILALVLRHLIGHAVNNETSAGNPVRIAAKQCTKRAAVFDIARDIVKTEHDMTRDTGAIGRLERNQRPGIIGNAGPELATFKRVKPRGLAVRLTKVPNGHFKTASL